MDSKKLSDVDHTMECGNPKCNSVKFRIVVNATATVWRELECAKCGSHYRPGFFDNDNRIAREQL